MKSPRFTDEQAGLRSKFKKTRLLRGMSQIRAAIELNLSLSTVCNFEQGITVGDETRERIEKFCEE